MPLISQSDFEAELALINTMIATYLATGQLPVSYSLPTGHSIDLTNVLASLYARRRELVEFMATIDPGYVVTVGG